MTRMIVALTVLGACDAPPADGTFVGNPSLTVRFAESPSQVVVTGRLEASEVFLTGCDDTTDVALGASDFDFMGSSSTDQIDIPTGSWCGIFLVGQRFEFGFTDGAVERTIVATDFDLRVPFGFRATEGDRYTLRLGDSAWLAELAALASPGETVIDGSDPELQRVFDRLSDQSGLESESAPLEAPPTDEADLMGLDLSPRGSATMQGGCGPGVNFDLAIPISEVAMAQVGLEGMGWCEGNVVFADPLVDRTALQDAEDGSSYRVRYNGIATECGALHCNTVYDESGVSLNRSCSVLAYCDSSGVSRAVGVLW